jgi:hypothetical protein
VRKPYDFLVVSLSLLLKPSMTPPRHQSLEEYLTDVLGRLPTAKTSDIQDLLPARWMPPSTNTS